MVRDFQSVIGKRGARADAGERGPAARHAGRLRRRRLQRHRPVPPVPRRRVVAIFGVEAGGQGVDDRTATRLASPAGGPGVLHGNRTYLLQDDDGQILEGHSISAGLDYPGVGPEHSGCTTAAASTTCRPPTRRRSRLPAVLPSWRASSRRWSRPTRSPMSPKLAPRLPQGPDHRDESVRPRRQGHLHRRQAPRHGHDDIETGDLHPGFRPLGRRFMDRRSNRAQMDGGQRGGRAWAHRIQRCAHRKG